MSSEATTQPKTLTLTNSEYSRILDKHVFSPRSFTGNEPRPESPDWNHGDGAPDWKNSGWFYSGTLYACNHDAPEAVAIFKSLNHQYSRDLEAWADARIEMLESASRGLEKCIAHCGRYDMEFKDEESEQSEMVLHPTGDYILFDDVRKCIASLKGASQ